MRSRMTRSQQEALTRAVCQDEIRNATEFAHEFAAQHGLNPVTVRSAVSRIRRDHGLLTRAPRKGGHMTTARTSENLLEQAQQALARAEAERDAMIEAFRQREREERADYDTEIVRLRRAIKSLSATKTRRTAAVQAGPKALRQIEAELAKGPLPQAEIVRVTGLNDGTVSYGLRALVEAGKIEPTGERVKGSRVFAQRKRRRRAA